MVPVRRLYFLWTWLPHFRAVAETQHVGRAASMLGITAPAISRAIAQLEADLGAPLFERRGRAIALNPAGLALAGVMRESMRQIDDVITSISAGTVRRQLTICCPGPYAASVVLPALRERTEVDAILRGLPADPISLLLGGQVDLCLLERRLTHSGLTCVALAEFDKVVCCGATHPLARARPHAVNKGLATFPFVAPPPSVDGVVGDDWPPDAPRVIGLSVDTLQLGIEAALAGDYLVVLPRPLAHAYQLHVLPYALPTASSTLYAAYRRVLPYSADVVPNLVTAMAAQMKRNRAATSLNRRQRSRK